MGYKLYGIQIIWDTNYMGYKLYGIQTLIGDIRIFRYEVVSF
jgi:hypothetical protein